jgi:bifunctional non-homologous end joining protein LigD
MSPRAKPASKLAPYRKKRDFAKTAEPSGSALVAPGTQLRFVIQKHDATRLHYDLRLELGGVFKSWAVTKGPSLDPADKRLAVEVEDHPLDYGDFEGTIPKGQYGGGAVMIWDRGYWAPGPGEDPEKALEKGELKFVLAGRKLRGGWVIVRLKRREREKRNSWLLIKHHDQFSHESGADVLDETKSVASGREMEAIAAGKGRKPKPFMTTVAGAADAVWDSNRQTEDNPADDVPAATKAPSRGSARKAIELRAAAGAKAPAKSAAARRSAPARARKRDPMPSFIPPELCKLEAAAPKGAGWAHEVKFDGYRLQMRVEKGRATLLTRRGLDWTDRFPVLAREAGRLPDCIVDGELVASGREGEPSFSALQEAIAEKRTDDLSYYAFDLLYTDGRDIRARPLRERKALLEGLLEGAASMIHYTTHIVGGGPDVIAAACAMGLEGVVSKRLAAAYRSERADAWVKVKCRRSEAVAIGGWLEEGGRFKSLIAGAPVKGGLRYIGRVGTGYGHAQVERLLPALRKAAADVSPFIAGPKPPRGARWADPRLVAEVEFAGWTTDGLLRQAAYKGLREDIMPKDVDLSPATDAVAAPAKRSARAAMRKRAPEPVPAGARITAPGKIRGVNVSSTDKELWPATEQTSAFTKGDLVAYYDAVGDWMLEHIRGRPCSIVRAPDGIEAEKFFQRHANRSFPAVFTRVVVSGEKQPYLQIDSMEALIAAGQLAATELHPWNCQPGDPETPGRFVFDLDPAPDVPFDRIVEAAKELSERLSELGLVGFCKTTGGKGLHVVTPLEPEPKRELRWPEAKAFALEICRRMAADSPDRYLVVMTKAKRPGRIFLDYLRNDRTATAVAPLSPRARPGATVSMPLTWPQARKGLDPKRYTLATAAAALKKGKPWTEYAEASRPFSAAAKRLASFSSVRRRR